MENKNVYVWLKVYKKNDENSNKGYILKVDVKYHKHLHGVHRDLPFLPDRMEINKCSKPVCNLYDKITMLST